MQEFNPLKDGDYISDGPSQINKNIESVASDFCGTSFPTSNLFLGMVCYRTDENKIYRLRQQSNNDLVWVMEYALTDGGITAKQAESLTDTLPITGGGTGADTASKACANIGALPLGGGTITGGITSKTQTVLVRDVDNGNLQINGATSYTNGAYILLSGKDGTMGGQFNLCATNGEIIVKLVGKPDGTLTWNGKQVTVGTKTETWTFTLADGSTASKKVVLE